MTKITLTQLGSIQNDNTAVAKINANSATITTAFDNTLSLNGTSPNQMQANLDMNSNRILNLPQPLNADEPALYSQLNAAVTGKGNVPLGGSVNQILSKKSSTDFDTQWITNTSNLIAGNNILITG